MTERVIPESLVIPTWQRRAVALAAATVCVLGSVEGCGSKSDSNPSGKCMTIPDGSSIRQELEAHDTGSLLLRNADSGEVTRLHGGPDVQANDRVELTVGAERRFDDHKALADC